MPNLILADFTFKYGCVFFLNLSFMIFYRCIDNLYYDFWRKRTIEFKQSWKDTNINKYSDFLNIFITYFKVFTCELQLGQIFSNFFKLIIFNENLAGKVCFNCPSLGTPGKVIYNLSGNIASHIGYGVPGLQPNNCDGFSLEGCVTCRGMTSGNVPYVRSLCLCWQWSWVWEVWSE